MKSIGHAEPDLAFWKVPSQTFKQKIDRQLDFCHFWSSDRTQKSLFFMIGSCEGLTFDLGHVHS